MNAGRTITELTEATSIPAGSSFPVEMGDGTGTKRVTQSTLEKQIEGDLPLGDLTELDTEKKDTLVGAINEVNKKTNIPVMTGATTAADGKAGLVPAPPAGKTNRVLNAAGEWVEGGGGAGGSTIHVTTEDPGLYGKTVSVTNGTETLTGTMTYSGVCDITGVLLSGNLRVYATNDEGNTAEQTINVTYYGTYNVELDARKEYSYINVTTAESTLFGKTVTASNGTDTASATIGTDGAARIKFDFTGNITVTASDSVNTASATLTVESEEAQSYAVTLQLYHLTVTTAESALNGKTVTLTNGSHVRTGTFASGAASITFDENFTGACTVSASDGTNTATAAINVVSGSYSYSATLTLAVVYTAILDFSKSDPAAMVSYEDDAAGMSKGWDVWKTKDIFKDLKNCVLKDGEVQYYLNPDDFSKKADGTASDITTLGNDVMLEIPQRLGYMIEWTDSAKTKLKVSVTNKAADESYNYDAFSLDSYNDCDKIYIGAFKGHGSGNKLYSSSGKAVAVSQTIDTFRTWARARGTGYQQRTYASVKLMQCLYIIAHGTLNSQGAVGMGYVKSSHSAGVNTGGTNTYGFDSEIIKASTPAYMTDQDHQVKCLGIEDFWGNYWEFVEGLTSDASRNIMTCQCAKDFKTDGSTYTNNGNGGVTGNIGNYMSKPQGGSNAGFTAQAVSGSDSTYFCDGAYLNASCLAVFGGCWDAAANAGAFRLNVSYAFSISHASVGARLMYLHKEAA